MTQRTKFRRLPRGLTLLEVIVSIAIMGMVSLLIYGAFDGLAKSKRGLGNVNDRYHQGRATMKRLAREISCAFISLHRPINDSLVTAETIFVAKDSSPADRLAMTTFSHRRMMANSHESDQAEISYFGSRNPDITGVTDLARREQANIDAKPDSGGVVYVLAEDIDLFDLKFLDPMTGSWVDSWDTTQATAQLNRMPLQVRVTLVLNGGIGGKPVRFEEKVPISMIQPLSFGIPR
jgi:general secretion pathway protein J